MIKNTHIQPLKILNVKKFLDGQIAVDKIYSSTAVQLFIKHRNHDRGPIARALRGIRSEIPRYVARDFLDLLHDTETV